MKTQGETKQKLKQVIFRHKKKFVEEGLKHRPCNCTYNGIVRVPDHMGNRSVVRICLYRAGNEDWNNRTCDETLGGAEQAQECPMFHKRHTKESLKAEFDTLLGLDGTPVEIGWIAKHYPDVAALMWTLGPNGKSLKMNGKPEAEEGSESILMFFGTEHLEEPDSVPEEPLEDG